MNFFSISPFKNSIILGLIITFSFATGCIVTIVLLQHRQSVILYVEQCIDWLGLRKTVETPPDDCEICGIIKCNRHMTAPNREPWRSVFVSRELDKAVESLYTNILNGFVASWFSLLSRNEDFVRTLKYNLREVTCRVIIKLKEVSLSRFIYS